MIAVSVVRTSAASAFVIATLMEIISCLGVGSDNNVTVGVFTLTPRNCSVHLLNGCVDNSSLVGIHRLKVCLSACLDSLESKLSAENFKSFFSFFSVVACVDCYLEIAAVCVVCNKTCKILERVESFASSADYKANVLARKVKLNAAFD